MKTGLLAFGLTTLDIVAHPVEELTRTERAILIDGIACTPAGTAAGAAMVAAKLGLPVRIGGAVGDDMVGAFIRLGLEMTGVDVGLLERVPGMKSSTTMLTVEASGRRSSYHMLGAGIAASVMPQLVDAAREARFVHYGAVGGLKADGGPGAELLRAAKAAGAVVTCDLISPRESAHDELKRLLPHVDYFMPSAAEALGVSGASTLGEAAAYFRGLGAGACIIKNGVEGAWVSMGEADEVVPAFRVEAVDTTSCGDSFCAGFIAGLHQGWSPVEACRLGAMTAALVAQGPGTLGRLEGFEETAAAMAAHGAAGRRA